MRATKVILAILFLFGAVVQLNDPDPAIWIAVYLGAALLCALSVRQPRTYLPHLVLGVVCLVWALTLAPYVFGDIHFLDMFGAWEMKNEGIEQSRELYGLFFISLAMFFLAFKEYRESRAKTTS